jgi:hypothetical protein
MVKEEEAEKRGVDSVEGGCGFLPPQYSNPLLWSKDMKGLWGGFWEENGFGLGELGDAVWKDEAPAAPKAANGFVL